MINTVIIGTDDVTLSDVKTHLNVTYNTDDAYLESLIAVSLNAVESYCRRDFLLRQNTQLLGATKTGTVPSRLMSDITSRPIDDEVFLQYILNAGTLSIDLPKQNLLNLDDNYHYYINNYIVSELNEVYQNDVDSAITLLWKTGLHEIPSAIKHARLLLIGTYYENREDTVTSVHTETIPTGISFLLEAHIAPQVG